MKKGIRTSSYLRTAVCILFWLFLWQLLSLYIHQKILLVGPLETAGRLAELAFGIGGQAGECAAFWKAIGYSFVRIVGGFLTASILGCVLGAAAGRLRPLRELLAPLVFTMKAIPVASFIILVLIWIPSRNLGFVISSLMVFPIVYTNVLGGMDAMDPKLNEMADVFELSFSDRLRCIYLSQLLPYLRNGFSLGLGLCWKSGVAAEVIGIPRGSIGERLYQSKVYLETPDLLAWTVVIVLLSVVFEQLFLKLADLLIERISG